MLPELDSLRRPASLVRLPDGQDVPLTDRVRRVLDTAPVRRLASISQLGMVGLVYPGANHHRLEHSLGVYHNALRLLEPLSANDRLNDPDTAEAFLLAALLHDIGHSPFSHPIEDMRLAGLDEHEDRAQAWLQSHELRELIERDWSCPIDQIVGLVRPEKSDRTLGFAERFFSSCLSGPIDVDKLDYLQRDSLHAGVPYGRNFDEARLIHSLCIHPQRPELAVIEKGRTAAEMMVFARYVMFSEVYWHHAVRAATAMLQRAVFLLQNRMDLPASFRGTDAEWITLLRRTAQGSVAEPLVEGLFGPRRILHKRLAEFDVLCGVETHMRLARRPHWWLVACAERLAERLAAETGIPVDAADVLIDAPPVKLEVDVNIDVVRRDGSVRSLEQLSPVASVLARQQFDHHVKAVRIFVRPDLRNDLRRHFPNSESMETVIASTVEAVESDVV